MALNLAHIHEEVSRVQAVLSPDLLKKDWAAKSETDNPLKGHCYAASEALYHRLGGKEGGWTPQRLNHASWPEALAEGETHWFLKHRDGTIVDATAAQFAPLQVPHAQATGAGFMTRDPSFRARIIMERMDALSPAQAFAR